MTLQRKILLRIYVLTLLIILAMSVTYFYLFTHNIRNRSHQRVAMAYEIIFDDLRTRVKTVMPQIDQFIQTALISPVYMIHMFQIQQDTSVQELSVRDITKKMTYLSGIALEMHEFTKLVEAREFLLYDQNRNLLAASLISDDDHVTGVYLPQVRDGVFARIREGDLWYGMLQHLDEIPEIPLPKSISSVYEVPLPETATVTASKRSGQLTLRFTVPMVDKGETYGVCVLYIGIRQQDVERYARLSGTEVNVFAESTYSVGTLSEFNFLTREFTRSRHNIDWLSLSELPPAEFAQVKIRNQSYYQGSLALGDVDTLVGAITVNLPRQLEAEERKDFFLVVAGITLVFCILVAGEALGLSSAIAQPIAHLMDAMQEMRTGNLDVKAPVETQDEIGKLASTFNTMTAQLKESFTRIEHQNQELQRLDKLKDEFLANTSHELRTPLNGIAGLAGTLLDGVDGPLNEEERKHVQMIQQSSTRLANLVNALLDFSRVKSEKLLLHVAPFPLAEVTEVVCAFARELLEEKSLEIRTEIPSDLPEIYADIDRVEQILTNLIGNAIKFTKQGTITISAEQDGEMVRISVHDTGIGIEPEALERIFNPFEQADGSITREFGGTGLGLSITKELAELHGGRIWVESEVGVGSTFYVTLPCTENAVPEMSRPHALRENTSMDAPRPLPQSGPSDVATQERPHEQDIPEGAFPVSGQAFPVSGQASSLSFEPGGLAPEEKALPLSFQDEGGFPSESLRGEVSGKGHTILVIDDDPTNLEVLSTQLVHAGFTVLTASNGQEAFEVINGYEIDLILCDVMMPLVDGYTFAMRMREKEQLRDIPLIFVSAKDQPKDIAKGYRVGGVDYLIKPVEHDELLMKVNALVGLRQRTRARYVPPDAIRTVDRLYDVEQEKEDQFTNIQHGNGETVLVVDDEPINVEVLKTQLRQHDYRVMVASNGPEALQLVERERPDLVLLDLMMPRMSGFRVCQILRQEKQMWDLPIIMLTAKSNIYDKVYGLNIGANDYIVKPFHLDELLTRIHVLLNIATLQQELLQMNESLRAEIIERQQAEEALQIEIVERKKAEEALRQLNEDLEHRVEERTMELRTSLENLKQTQQHLVQSEKMAALGGLVAGIAHELNTPIGVGITAASFLSDRSEELQQWHASRQMGEVELEKYLGIVRETSRMILHSLQRVARQIQNFKQAAVDQSGLGRRSFVVKPYLEDTLRMLHPELKGTQHQITVTGDEMLKMESYPGALSQVVTSLVMNSIAHGYRKGEQGHLQFEVMRQQDRLLLEYTDDGCGIPPEHLPKIFEPFFTTARSSGGSGLGLHIVYNLVTHKLKGTIQCESRMDMGTTFRLNLPLSLPEIT